MSFLLRNNKRGTNDGAGRTRQNLTAMSSDRRVIPQPKASFIRAKYQPNQLFQRKAKFGSQSGNQFLVERSVHRQQKAHPNVTTTMAKQAEVQNQRQDISGAMTMSEVLEDIRVLQQQQKEAQRKLANARITKDHRLQHCTALESKLEKMMYSNGALRAQIREHRDFLSCGTRELGTCRLAGGRAGNDIRDFEKKLKQGLHSSRMIISIRRKVESTIIAVKNKEAILLRLKTESREKLNLLDKELATAQQDEHSLRSSIQEAVSKCQTSSESLYQIRAENSKLEQEMLSAQSTEESTKLKAEAIDEEISHEGRRHREGMIELKNKLLDYQKQAENITLEEKALLAAFEEKKCHLLEKKRCIVDLKKREGLDPDIISTDFHDPIPSFDKQLLNAKLEGEERRIRSTLAENEDLKKSITRLREEILQTQEKTKVNRLRTSSLLASCREMQTIEKDRRVKMETFQKGVVGEREEVEKLVKVSRDLQTERDQEATRHARAISECKEAIKNDQANIVAFRIQIEAEDSATVRSASIWEKQKRDYSNRLEKASARTKDSEKALKALDAMLENRREDHERGLVEKIEKIETRMVSSRESTKAQILELLQRYPQLQAVKFSYDSNKTEKDHAEAALETLIAELEAHVRVSKKERDARKAERKEARRKTEIARVEAKRKEEVGRKNGERIQTDITHKEEGNRPTEVSKHSEEESTSAPNGQDNVKMRQKRAKKAKGAEFFFPQIQNGKPDDETPVHPKRLLPVFESQAIGPKQPRAIIATSQNSDKRVRWEDDDDEKTNIDLLNFPQQEKSKVTLPKRKHQYGRGKDSTSTTRISSKSHSDSATIKALKTKDSKEQGEASGDKLKTRGGAGASSEVASSKIDRHKKEYRQAKQHESSKKKSSDKRRSSCRDAKGRSSKHKKSDIKSKSVRNLFHPLGLITKEPTASVPKSKKLEPSNSMKKTKMLKAKDTTVASSERSRHSRKRKHKETFITQASGLSSSEGAPSKARRRKKKESSGTKEKVSTLLRDNTYDFHF